MEGEGRPVRAVFGLGSLTDSQERGYVRRQPGGRGREGVEPMAAASTSRRWATGSLDVGSNSSDSDSDSDSEDGAAPPWL